MLQPTAYSQRHYRARAAAHRAMAIAALTSNSSARVRYRRYQAHMQQATVLLHLAHHDDTSASAQEVNA